MIIIIVCQSELVDEVRTLLCFKMKKGRDASGARVCVWDSRPRKTG